MQSMRRWVSVAVLLAVGACSPSPRPVAPSPPSASAQLAAADAELRAGCLDCLVAAYDAYVSLRQTAGAVRAASLIALRERELGMINSGHLDRARALAAGDSTLPLAVSTLPDVADALPALRGGAGAFAATDVERARARTLREHSDAWAALLRGAAHDDPAAAYMWVALACDAFDARTLTPAAIFESASPFAGAPLLVYREALCRTANGATLEAILAADARFVETTYSLGFLALAARPPKLDLSDQWFRRAYAWRPKWPALTLAMGGVALTGEEFDRAHTMYQETLALDAHSGEAMFGDLRALTYAGASADAIAMADRMIDERWFVGDAHYWRAYNELQVSRLDEAWRDIEEAERTLVNAQVPKLAGLIAYRRQELDVAIARFLTSLGRDPFDCETQFYLGVTHADLRHWAQTADVLKTAASCLASAEVALTEEIAHIRESDVADDRKARQIARREQQIADGRRRIAASWFDVAVASFSLSNKDEARQYAEKVIDDEQFGERAREILARLR
jgi:tetratricopeptide (TPR) repeat protein